MLLFGWMNVTTSFLYSFYCLSNILYYINVPMQTIANFLSVCRYCFYMGSDTIGTYWE